MYTIDYIVKGMKCSCAYMTLEAALVGLDELASGIFGEVEAISFYRIK